MRTWPRPLLPASVIINEAEACGADGHEQIDGQWDQLGKGLLAIGLVGLVSMSLCFAALRGRTRRG